MKENTIICSCCGAVLNEDTTEYFDGQYLCEDCFDNETVLCDNCGGAIKGKGGVVSDSKGNNYCLYCAKRKLDLLKKMGVKEKFSTVDGLKYAFED